MSQRIARRTFLSMTALGAAASRALAGLALERSTRAGGEHGRIRVRPFDLKSVRLRPGAVRDALEVNRRYLMGLDPDRLLHMFRVTAGLPSNAEPLGGW